MSKTLRTASRPGSVWWRIALIVLVVGPIVFVVSRSIGYPGRVTSPDVVGLVTSNTTDPDLTAHVVLDGGQTLTVSRADRTLGGLGGPADLQFAGSHPARWYLAGHKSDQPDCFWISASRAYSEPDAVVLAFQDWPGVGVRLPKAPGYDDSKLVVSASGGRLRYSSIGPISLCADEKGRINGRR